MKHLIKIESTAHGVLGVRHTGLDNQYCEAGELVILKWQPDAKWGLQEAHYIDKQGNITPIDLGNGKEVVAFVMPDKDIVVGGTFKRFAIEDWKFAEAKAGNLASIDANENIADSGIAASDVATKEELTKVNPFKGWFSNTTALNTAYPTPSVGDYAYVKGATSSDPASIYECTTAGTWTDSGRTADTSNVQTFATGEEVNEVHIINDFSTGGTEDVLSAEQGKSINFKINTVGQLIVSLFKKCVYTDNNVQDAVAELESMFVENISYITAVYTQSGTVYNGQQLSELRDDLVVTAYYSNGTSEAVANYVLSGKLTTGTSTITVTYGGVTDTFDVTVTSSLIITFASTDIEPGYTSSTVYTNNGSSWPYTGPNAKRCYTPVFTKTIVGGHRYRVTVNFSANPDNKTFWLDAQGYTQSALNKLNGGHGTMDHSRDRVTGGPVVLDANNQAEFTLPVYSFEGTTDSQYEVKVVRCNMGLSGDSSNFPSNVTFTSIVIEQVE